MNLWEFGLPCGKLHTLQKLVFFSVLTLIFLTLFSPNLHPFQINPSTPLLSSSSSSSSSPPTPFPSQPSLQPNPLPTPPPSLPASVGEGAEGCDWSRGEWVWNPQGPPYTNLTCGAIQEHQNCIKYGRPDRDFLKWRWMPDGCDLPSFDPAAFMELVRGRSMAFVGDSLARNQMQSLMCLLSRVEHPRDVSHTPDLNFRRMHYDAHNFTLSIFWSPFLVKSEEGHLEGFSWRGLWNLSLDEVDLTWASEVRNFDFVVISSGNWFSRPSLFYENRRLVGSNYFLHGNITDLTLFHGHLRAFRTAFDAINRLENFKGTVFLRTVSPSHFEHGEWNRGGDCVRTMPSGQNETVMAATDARLYEDQVREYQRAKEEGVKKGVSFKLLDITMAMVVRPDGHPSRYGHWPGENVTLHNDCVHWCLPGPVDMWNDLLLQLLKG